MEQNRDSRKAAREQSRQEREPNRSTEEDQDEDEDENQNQNGGRTRQKGNNMIEKGEILTLEDNKSYVVVSTTKLNNINYVYLMNPENYAEFMFCAYDNEDGLYEVEDGELLQQLLEIFNNDLNKINPNEQDFFYRQ